MSAAAASHAAPVAAAPAPVARHWTRRPGVVAALAIALVVVGYLALRAIGVGQTATLISTGAIEERERLILADFENRTSDTTQGATVTELMRIGLSQSQAVSVMDPLQLSRTLELMRRDPSEGVPSAVALEATEREGMKGVITGEVVAVGSGLAISARLITTAGEVLVAETENARSADDLVAAVDRLSDRLRARFGESLRLIRGSQPLEAVTTGSMRALRVFSQGLQAWNQGDNARALQLLKEAIAEDSTFAMAWRKLAIILWNNQAQRSLAVEAATRAHELRDRLTARERYLVTAAYHTVVTGNRDQQISAYRTVLDMHPNDAYALNNIGVVYSQLRDPERSAEYYARALGVDSTLRLHYSNLSGALARLRLFDSAAVIARRFEERFPENPEVKLAYVLNAAYRQDYDSARVLVQALLDDQRGTVWWEAIAYEWWGHLDALSGRFESAQRLWRRAFGLTSEQGLRGQYLLRIARRAILERLLLNDSVRALRLLDEALRLHPLEELAPLDRPYGHLAVAFAAAGETDRARSLLAEYEATPEADRSENAILWTHGARGVIALAEGRPEEAIEQLRQFDDGNECWTCAYPWLARAYDRLGVEDSVRVLYERFAEIPSADLWYDGAHLAHGYMRLGELYEKRGEREKAAHYYGRFVSLWEQADPALQDWVRQAREALSRVTAEASGTD